MLNKIQSFFGNSKNREEISQAFERAAAWVVKASVVLFPVFILPFPAMPLESMKVHFVAAVSLLTLSLIVISALFSSKYTVRIHGVLCGLAAVLAVSFVSAMVSPSRNTALVGIGGREMWSVLTYLYFFVLVFLIGNLFKRKEEILSLLLAFGLGIGLAGALEIFQLSGRFLYPFSFTHQRIWTPLGTPKIFSFFSAAGIIASIIYLRSVFGTSKLPASILAICAALINFFILLRIDFYGAWIFLAFGSLVYIFGSFLVKKHNIFFDKYLPIAAFIVAVVLTMVGSPLRQNLIPEFNLDPKTSWDITKKALGENMFLGTGPGTFEFSYSLWRSPESNSGNFWNVRFDRPDKHFLTILSTTGILGLLAFFASFAVLIFAVWQKIKNKSSDADMAFCLGLLGLLYLLTSYFYTSSVSFLWYASVVFGLALGALGRDIAIRQETKKYKFIGLGILALLLVAILRFGILECAALIKETHFAAAFKVDATPAARYEKMEAAMRYGKDDPRVLRAYLRAALQYANELGRTKDPDGAKIQKLLENSTSSAKSATVSEPADVENWLALGAVYQNLLPFVEGSGEWVVRAYTEALKREPTNPLPGVEMGKGYLTLGNRMEQDGADKDLVQKIYQRAEEELIKALNLKADYAPTHFYLGLVYERQGRNNDAMLKLEAVKKFNPADVGVAYELGLLYVKMGSLEKARAEFERAVANLPAFSDARWQLANVLLRQGHPSEAIEELKKILQYNPDNELVKKAIEEIKLGRSRL